MDITDSRVIALTGYSLVLGVALGICWGVWSFIRIVLTPSHKTDVKSRVLCDMITFIFDVVFALFASVCAVFLFFGANNGRIRLLGLAGCAAGFAVYHVLLGKRLLKTGERFIFAVRRALRFIYRKTLQRVFRMFGHMFTAPVRVIKRRARLRKPKRKQKRRAQPEEKFTM